METVGEPVPVATMRAHRSEVTCADASGAWLATGGGEGALRLWRWRRAAGWAEAAAAERAHRYGAAAARWAAGGALLASAGGEGAARLWAARTLRPRGALLAAAAAPARALCWASAERLLVGHDDGAVRAWRVRGGVLLACVRAHEGSLRALAALGNVTLLLTACTEGVLKIFNLEDIWNSDTEGTSTPVPILWEDGAHDLGVLCADASVCGRAAATGGQDGRVRVWRATPRTTAGSVPRAAAGSVLSGHGAAVTALRWARGTALLATASLDRTARIWAVDAHICLRVLHAHTRYLTCIFVPQHARYVITGSNDKTVRTWSLSSFNIDDDLEPECSPLVHFGLGDLQGIGPVDDDLLLDEVDSSDSDAGVEAKCVWRSRDEHASAVNCIATHGDLLATASSDGMVRVFRWCEQLETLQVEKRLTGHQYPVLSVDFGAGGVVLLSAGLDGRACLWDVETGSELMSVWAAGAASGESGGGGGGGGGGVRGGRVSPHREPLLLLATDDGVAALWTMDGDGSDPVHVYEGAAGAAEAVTCCAWAGGGRAAAAGGAGGDLRLLAPPPRARQLWLHSAAHDLGVLSCDFAPEEEGEEEDESQEYLLASGGMDEVVKIWIVEFASEDVTVRQGAVLSAHGGAVQSVRWGAAGAGRVLATSGADRWARVWRVAGGGRAGALRVSQAAAVPSGGAGGAPAAAFLGPSLLAVGALDGQLAVWRLPDDMDVQSNEQDEDGVEPRWWGEAGVVRWLKEYVSRFPESPVTPDEETRLVAAVHAHGLRGAQLLDEPLDKLLEYFGYGTEEVESISSSKELDEGSSETTVEARSLEEEDTRAKVEMILRTELEWLRRPPLSYEEEATVPHELRCALSHAAALRPRGAPDGYTYEHAALAHWLTAVGQVSPITGRRLRGSSALNRGVLTALRAHLTGIKDS